jgi:hypothetical protein
MASLTNLRSEVKRLLNANQRLRKDLKSQVDKQSLQIIELQNNFSALTETLTAREIGSITDQNVRNFIFPGCASKNYRIRSLNNLKHFVKDMNNAASKDLCDSNAPSHWEKLDSEVKTDILARYDYIESIAPELASFIDDLKESSSHLY